jgi:hypothetical protein
LSEALKLVNATVTAAIEAAEVKTIEEHSIESDEGS